jgi:hypothetical protein
MACMACMACVVRAFVLCCMGWGLMAMAGVVCMFTCVFFPPKKEGAKTTKPKPKACHGRTLTPFSQLPCMQKKGSVHGPCRLLDFELEVGAFVGGPPNPLGPYTYLHLHRHPDTTHTHKTYIHSHVGRDGHEHVWVHASYPYPTLS